MLVMIMVVMMRIDRLGWIRIDRNRIFEKERIDGLVNILQKIADDWCGAKNVADSLLRYLGTADLRFSCLLIDDGF
jgi:hypothetical protein